jgi:hypothetical protein
MAVEQYYLAALTCGVSLCAESKRQTVFRTLVLVVSGARGSAVCHCNLPAMQFLANIPFSSRVILNAKVTAYIVCLTY